MKLPIFLVLLAAALVSVAQSPAPPTAFDAFTIKAAPPPSGNRIRIQNQIDPTRVTIENMPLRQIVLNAFELKPYQLTAPDWMNEERFNITAVTSAPASKEEMNKLLQQLLIEQFQLKLHHDSKVMDAYALTVAAGGSKLQPPGPDGVKMEMPFKVQGMPERPLTKDQPMMMMRIDQTGVTSTTLVGDLTMSGLANTLSRQLGKPVVDESGIAGDFGINITYSVPSNAMRGLVPAGAGTMMMMRTARGGPPPPPPGSGDAPKANAPAEASEPTPSIFTVLAEKLGLKLDARKAPVDVVVIDSAVKAPAGGL